MRLLGYIDFSLIDVIPEMRPSCEDTNASSTSEWDRYVVRGFLLISYGERRQLACLPIIQKMDQSIYAKFPKDTFPAYHFS